MIKTFKSKQLAVLWAGKRSKIDARLTKRVLVRLDRIDLASVVDEMNLPGFNFHSLSGYNPTRYTTHVNGPWCITFEFEGGDVIQLTLSNAIREKAKMTQYPAIRTPDRCPSHPGALLGDILPETGKTKVQIAEMLGISRQQLYDILNERKPVSANVAARLGKLFGDGAGIWLRMQAAHDAWHAERETDLSNIPTLAHG